ncbi:MAG TPA: flagellar export protein FliJ [Steroidobacteraceae bacterium]|nr:flagellar export protein FliJ [Steroidobacteraceae bacterium]
MPRMRQLKTAHGVLESDERRKAQTLASSERQVHESEAKLAELGGYREAYIRDFASRAGAGMNAARARDYQVFLARLDEALREQTEIVAQARATRTELLAKWSGAARRSAAVDRALERGVSEERRRLERREQHDADERAQGRWSAGGKRRVP